LISVHRTVANSPDRVFTAYLASRIWATGRATRFLKPIQTAPRQRSSFDGQDRQRRREARDISNETTVVADFGAGDNTVEADASGNIATALLVRLVGYG
jgi:O-succinylbenzoate synthase